MFRIGKPTEAAAASTLASTAAIASVPVSRPTTRRCTGIWREVAALSIHPLRNALATDPWLTVKPCPIATGVNRHAPLFG